jgi:ABC-type amino acid transport system permease subunit
VAIILFVSAYLAEIVRAGPQSVPRQHEEAATALGLSWWLSMRFTGGGANGGAYNLGCFAYLI